MPAIFPPNFLCFSTTGKTTDLCYNNSPCSGTSYGSEIYVKTQLGICCGVQRPNSWTKSKQKSQEFSSLLFKVISTALPWDFYFFKLTQPLRLSYCTVYTVNEKRGKPNRKPYPLPYGLRNPYKNLKSENSLDYTQKPQRNCTFMKSALGGEPWPEFSSIYM